MRLNGFATRTLATRMTNDTGPVTVEYTARGRRVRKTFPGMYPARRFYVAKYKAGASPKVVSTKEAPR